jgi:two-component system, NtrC family, sensor histidine kinase PilS
MPAPSENRWKLGPLAVAIPSLAQDDRDEFTRIWQGFMTARLALGLVLTVLQGTLHASGTAQSRWLMAICVTYVAGALVTRFVLRPRPLGGAFGRHWAAMVGLDLAVFSALQYLQGSGINYTPLFALPILLTAVLGSLRLALGTAAGVIVLFLGSTFWSFLERPSDTTPYFVQSALTGAGYFVIAFLANQLATRLASEGHKARQHARAAHIQSQVNELVIESLPDGVMVVDAQGMVRALNPPARQLLNLGHDLQTDSVQLSQHAAWGPLREVVNRSIQSMQGQDSELTLHYPHQGPLRVLVRTRLANPLDGDQERLCVLFLQDQREQEARMRTERLASMGRMSTAVAHEIRNPLAAITQANALLEEDLTDPHQKRLTHMVGQNAKRLERIVEEILDVSRIPAQARNTSSHSLALYAFLHRIGVDWAAQSGRTTSFSMQWEAQDVEVPFDAEHLRRILVNLLENAKRYASTQADAIQVFGTHSPQWAQVTVWSDGAPMDPSVQRHLFEPFFSSESRSSGLGLYICRELCERHGASITYQRMDRAARGTQVAGNAFVITIPQTEATDTSATPWQPTLY